MDYLFPVFNVFLGTVFLLTGLKIYRPFKKEKEDAMMKKFKTFYIIGGFGLIVWGLVKLFQVI
jgi:FtsH-binding integral membrane protein